MKVMIVDDSISARKLLHITFEQYGCTIIEAQDGKEGFDLAALHKPDIIISDGLMPRMDGFQLLRALKTDPVLKPIPFILYTSAYTGEKEAELARSLGAEAVVEKGTKPEHLWEKVCDVIKDRDACHKTSAHQAVDESNEQYLGEYSQIVATKLEETVKELEAEHALRTQAEEMIQKRLVVLTQPMEGGKITFEELFNIDDVQRLQDEFAMATGVASIITHTDGTPLTAPSNFTNLCSEIIRKTEKGRANCFKSDAAIGRHHPEGPIVQPCLSGGLWDAGAGITVGGQHIANWLIGQVRDEAQTEEKMRAYAREIGVDEASFMKAFLEVPAMSRARFERIAKVLFTFANQLSTTAYQNILQARYITERNTAVETLHLQTVELGHEVEERQRTQESLQEQAALLEEEIEKRQEAQCELEELNEQLELRVQERTSELIKRNAEVQRAYEDLKRVQAQLLQQDKMASIGQLAAGVAHEINNPIGFIISNLGSLGKYVEKLVAYLDADEKLLAGCDPAIGKIAAQERQKHKVDYIRKDLPNLIAETSDGAQRVRQIVQDLKSFSRVDGAEFVHADINEGLDSTLSIAWNELKYKATVTKDYGQLPQLWCNPGQLNQVFLNILVNASHAIVGHGEIRITTREEGGSVRIDISDTGGGIPPESVKRIFDPFFTTKEVGKGTGLGLSIAYDIVVNKHGGRIDATSEIGKGTTFSIMLPMKSE